MKSLTVKFDIEPSWDWNFPLIFRVSLLLLRNFTGFCDEPFEFAYVCFSRHNYFRLTNQLVEFLSGSILLIKVAHRIVASQYNSSWVIEHRGKRKAFRAIFFNCWRTAKFSLSNQRVQTASSTRRVLGLRSYKERKKNTEHSKQQRNLEELSGILMKKSNNGNQEHYFLALAC